MTSQFEEFAAALDAAFFRYAHLGGALEFYMFVLETPGLQHAVNRSLSAPETDWKEIHRFMAIDGERITWYPSVPISEVLAQRNALMGFLYGVTLSSLVGDLDFYLASVLRVHFARNDSTGSAWDAFVSSTGIALLDLPNGLLIYTLLQERHKIVHNNGRIDERLLARLGRQGISDPRNVGDPIQKSHLDILHSFNLIRAFAEKVDRDVSVVLANRLSGRERR
jgi:hypothetical protein